MRSLLFVVGAALVGAPGCASPERAAGPGAGASFAPAAPTAARRLPPAARSGPVFAAPQPSQAVRDRAALAEACRRDADRVVLYRDRGQLMREDERDARIGTEQSIYARRVETDRLGRAFERDRIAAECLEQDSRPMMPPARR
jgi:hypothetical protein